MQASEEMQPPSNFLLTNLLTRMFDPTQELKERLQALKEFKEYTMEADVGGSTIKDTQDLANKTVKKMKQLQTRLPIALLEKYKTQWEDLPEQASDLNRLVAQFDTGLDRIEGTIKLTVGSEDRQESHS